MPSSSETVERYMPLARELTMRYLVGADPADPQVINEWLTRARAGLAMVVADSEREPGRPLRAAAVAAIIGELRRGFRQDLPATGLLLR